MDNDFAIDAIFTTHTSKHTNQVGKCHTDFSTKKATSSGRLLSVIVRYLLSIFRSEFFTAFAIVIDKDDLRIGIDRVAGCRIDLFVSL